MTTLLSLECFLFFRVYAGIKLIDYTFEGLIALRKLLIHSFVAQLFQWVS